ncbi:hypothetical protein ACIBEK_12045 [Nocardia fusca]|uniref:hypothetical protein n=1 Tax=Nocardia fusca TaxID=941183 RepID=UPI00379D15E8
MSQVAGSMVKAIENAWAGLRAQHPDIPDVVVTVAAGSVGRRGVRLGRFGPDRWMHNGVWVSELFVGGEGFAHGPREVLGVLLHEAVHGIARTRGIKDTSRGGAYHNKKYFELAGEVGLAVERQDGRGWAHTSLTDATVQRYRREIELIGSSLVAHRRSEHDGIPDPVSTKGDELGDEESGEEEVPERSPKNGRSLICQCDPVRRVRAHQRTIDAGPILCGVCQQPFICTTETES